MWIFTKVSAILVLILLHSASAQIDPTIDARLEKRAHTFENLTLPFRLYVPDAYAADEQYPVLLFLHGVRWAGTDNTSQLDNELALYWIDSTRQATAPCFVIYPQIPSGTQWEMISGEVADFPTAPQLATAHDIVREMAKEFSIDENRQYVCGKSIGGLGVYGIISRYPGRYAAAIPAAGHYVYRSITELSDCAFWIFHNKDDAAVPVSQSRHIVSELEKLGNGVVYTHCDYKSGECDTMSNEAIDETIKNGARFMYSEFDDAGHQLEPHVVTTHGLYEWVMQQSNANVFVNSPKANVDFVLMPSYPNPFNASTSISFELSTAAFVTLTIKNIKGQTLAVLEKNRLAAGRYSYRWDARQQSSGIYFVELQAGEAQKTRRCLLLR